MAKMGNMRGAQVISKAWNRKMKERAHSPSQINNLQNFQKHFNGVYENIQEEAYMDDGAEEMKA